MSTTLSDIRSRIADDLDRSDLSTQIDKAVNRAITYYEKEQFWFNQNTATFTTVNNQKSYSSADGIPTDIAEINYLEITVSTYQYEMEPKPYDWIKRKIGFNFLGIPRHYAYYNNSFWFYLVPNGAYTITASYQKTFTALSSDTDTNVFLTNAEDLIEARSRWWVCNRILQDNDLAAVAKQEEMDALDSLRSKTAKLITSHRILPTSF